MISAKEKVKNKMSKLDKFHDWFHATQPTWLRNIKNPWYEFISGIFLIPLLLTTHLTHISPVWALVTYILACVLWEMLFSGFKLSDIGYRMLAAWLVFTVYILEFYNG